MADSSVNVLFRCLSVSAVFIIIFCSFCSSFDLEGSSASYAKFQKWVPCQNGSLSLEFKNSQLHSLLFYMDNSQYEYFELKMVSGTLHLRFNLGEGSMMLSAGQNLNNNQWHKVGIKRNGKFTKLTVDNVASTGEYKWIDTEFEDKLQEHYFFLGGIPKEYKDKISKLALPSVYYEPPFSGSIRNLLFSNCGKPFQRPEMVDYVGIVADNDKCVTENPCLHSGVCLTRDAGVMCDCAQTDYEGDNCELEKKPSEVTFFGAQYLSYDLSGGGDDIVSNNEQISLYFRTTQPDGLIFHTGNAGDYLTVCLKDGAVVVTLNLGSGEYKAIVSAQGFSLDDNHWHHLVVKRKTREVNIEVDGSHKRQGSTVGNFKVLSSSVVYVGGSPHTSRLPGSVVSSNFKGCLKKVVFQADSLKLDITELVLNNHGFIDVVGEVVFNKCQDMIESLPITFLTSESHIVLPKWDVGTRTGSISFKFQTNEQNGVIMYNSRTADNLDFFAVEILEGHLYLIIDLGSGPLKIKVSQKRVDDSNIHEVMFEHRGQEGYVNMDGVRTPYHVPGESAQLDLDGSLYIGSIGGDKDSSSLPKEIWSGMLGYGYVGCFQDLTLNGNKVDLLTIARKQIAKGITDICRPLEPLCLSRPCIHNGICMDGWNRYVCQCQGTGYRGTVCQDSATTLDFDGVQYMKITMPEESHTEVEDISLRFRTIRSNGLLFLTSSDLSSDTMELYLYMGKVKLDLVIGSGKKSLAVGRALNDDRWHTVYIRRRSNSIQLGLDQNRPVVDQLTGDKSALDFRKIEVGHVVQEDNLWSRHAGFAGAMQQFIFNGNEFFELAKDGDIENIKVTARFDSEEHVLRYPVTFKSTVAYAVLPSLNAYSLFWIYFKFKTTEPEGLIFYNNGKIRDFIALELQKGFLYYVYDMGSGAQRIRVNTLEALNDNEWHDVSILRPEMDRQLIHVDNDPPTVDNMVGSETVHFNFLDGQLYVGGVEKNMYNVLPKLIMSRHGFQGCMASVDLNGIMPNIVTDAKAKHYSVIEGCRGPTSECRQDSCYNGGTCIQQWNSYLCDCDMTSFAGPTCLDESISYKYGKNGGLITMEFPNGKQPDTKLDQMALAFKTWQRDCVLIRIDSSDSNDYIEMELVNGNVFVVYNMGTLDHPVGELFERVNDGKYHVVKFIRSGPNATIQVDNFNEVKKNPAAPQLDVFNHQASVNVGGKRGDYGQIQRPFTGTIYGFVLNGNRILDLAAMDDSRMTVEGDVVKNIPMRRESHGNMGEVQSTMGLKHTTPKQGITDEIIFSGMSPGCHGDDEEDCTIVAGSGTDDIITSAVIIKTTPRPPVTQSSEKTNKQNPPCDQDDDEDCLIEKEDTDKIPDKNITPHPVGEGYDTSNSTEEESKNKNGQKGELNIGLILGIVAVSVVALLILMFAVYKFQSREEGTYKVDESQNFAYLEAKKQQSNGTLLINNTSSNGRNGKKKDVKEWYV